MGLKEIWEKFTKKNKKYKELEEDYRLKKKLVERQKNSNERELERFMEEERQKRIKADLDNFRKQRQKEMWKSNIMDKKNIFKNDKQILKAPCIFKMKGGL